MGTKMGPFTAIMDPIFDRSQVGYLKLFYFEHVYLLDFEYYDFKKGNFIREVGEKSKKN
jgi:hypothetical protein